VTTIGVEVVVGGPRPSVKKASMVAPFTTVAAVAGLFATPV